MAFCPDCGHQLDNESNVCPVCSTKQENNNNINNNETSNLNNNFNSVKNQKPTKKNKGIGIIIGAAALVLIIILAVSVFGGKPYEKAIDNFINVAITGKVDKVKNLVPPAYWEYIEEELGMELDDMLEEIEDGISDSSEELKDDYGKNVKITYKVTNAEQFDKEDLKDVKDTLKERYDIPKKTITDAYELELELKIKGSEDSDEEETETYVVKIDGKWYMMDEYYNFMLPEV